MTSKPSKRHDREAHVLAALRTGLLPWINHVVAGGLTFDEAMTRLRSIAGLYYDEVSMELRRRRVEEAQQSRQDDPHLSDRLAKVDRDLGRGPGR